MCRVAGIIRPFATISNSEIIAMRDCMQHGGPDDAGVYINDNTHLALGHRRLSLIDLSNAGHQPMFSKDNNLVIVFNGEIYNYLTIQAELKFLGHQFISHSDTEVIIAAYQQWGDACFEKFNGMFALAIYDKEEQTLFIARDRVGVKPLLYYQDSDKFFFASEMKALMTMGIPRELDKTSLFSYFQLNYIPSPNSVFKNVHKLQPGSYLLIDLKKKSIQKKTERIKNI